MFNLLFIIFSLFGDPCINSFKYKEGLVQDTLYKYLPHTTVVDTEYHSFQKQGDTLFFITDYPLLKKFRVERVNTIFVEMEKKEVYIFSKRNKYLLSQFVDVKSIKTDKQRKELFSQISRHLLICK
jgi:hypothetical protein